MPRLTPQFINIEAPALTSAVLRAIIDSGDVIGHDESGRAILALAVEPWMIDHLAALGADNEDFEDGDYA